MTWSQPHKSIVVSDVQFLAKVPMPASVTRAHPTKFTVVSDVQFLAKVPMPASVTCVHPSKHISKTFGA